MQAMRMTRLAGREVPVLGQGTWHMGDSEPLHSEEVRTLRRGIDLGLTVIDTAELYGQGRSERLVGEAIKGRRDRVFLVSKVMPSHADREGTIRACERSLERLGTDRLDLYLLHWKGPHPLEQTIAGFEELVRQGKILSWGLSNFDQDDLAKLPQDTRPATDEVLYNLKQRWPESGLLDAARERGIPIIAYSPVEQGKLAHSRGLGRVAARHGATSAQIALAWAIRSGEVIAIPQTSSPHHVEENANALTIALSDEDLAELDESFPAPTDKEPMREH